MAIPMLWKVLRLTHKQCNYKCNRLFSSLTPEDLLKFIPKMPKDNKHVSKLRDNRLKGKKNKNDDSTASIVQMTILGNGARGNPRAICVATDHKSYMFNCGEGTQRLAHEHKIKLSKLEHIFFTRRCTENVSGLIGLALTCQDIGVPSLTLHGPPHMDKLFELYRVFMNVEGMSIHSRDYHETPFVDNVLTIDYIPIKCAHNEDTHSDKKLKVNHNDVNEISLAYVCKLHNRKGELIIEKCIELKVPPGPLLGKLKAGQDVTLPDNRVIRSEDVVAPEEKGQIFIILECPSLKHIDSLVSNETLKKYHNASSEEYNLIASVTHISPPEVTRDHRYQNWMSSFKSSVMHYMCNEQNSPLSLVGVHQLQTKLNLLDSYIFPPLINDNKDDQLIGTVLNSPTLCRHNLRPLNRVGFEPEAALKLEVEKYKDEAFATIGFEESLQLFHKQISNLKKNTEFCPEIVFLGTGSAIPSKVRNTSAILANISENTTLLLDCGEGTCGQLYRFYGSEFESQLRKIKGIYVSHLHADHHLGLLEIIKQRSRLTDEPTLLIIPPVVKKWMENYEDIEPIKHLYKDFPCELFTNSTDEFVLKTLELSHLKTVKVNHCKDSYGISITTSKEPNYKIAYSGDTMPSTAFIDLGFNCHLLIHEASMEDDLVHEARIKMHSTTSEAIEIGRKMHAKFTILTHFSQRYAKLPIFNEKFNDTIGVAFDNMRIRLDELQKLSLMVPVVKCLFNEHIEEMRMKTALKQRKRELLNQYLEVKALTR